MEPQKAVGGYFRDLGTLGDGQGRDCGWEALQRGAAQREERGAGDAGAGGAPGGQQGPPGPVAASGALPQNGDMVAMMGHPRGGLPQPPHIEARSPAPGHVDIPDVVAHPAFERLVNGIYTGRLVGEDTARMEVIMERQGATLREIRNRRRQHRHDHNPELGDMLIHCCGLVEALNQELMLIAKDGSHACNMFESQIRGILASDEGLASCSVANPGDEQQLRSTLKRKYGTQIRQLRDEFQRKKKKGKLPTVATDRLRAWWTEHMSWPYPSEDDKAELAKDSGLNTTQINNWFINQRKRHWNRVSQREKRPSAEMPMQYLSAMSPIAGHLDRDMGPEQKIHVDQDQGPQLEQEGKAGAVDWRAHGGL
ncbi:unnamed protein product [Ostreobium quekettii]|uniref:Uncharacterized protein n=1 Tax=Ostreobium quekettii TaxID=121088 RepID=A0A8S1JBP3_9CHLO|nr:unnamed protein product [Ostreobium quekettii]|eukprot:evm.model.scf_252EXC.2 EVM.evm.TU.scf_252EXC.2   scf_252EXC:44828-50908(+)